MTRRIGSRAQGYVIEWHGDDLLKAIAGGLDDAMFAAGEILIANATAKAPRDEGTLQESGYVSTPTKSNFVKKPGHRNEVKPRGEGVAAAGFAAPHAHLVEYGTSRMAAQPFFRPAFDESKKAMADAAASELRAGLK